MNIELVYQVLVHIYNRYLKIMFFFSLWGDLVRNVSFNLVLFKVPGDLVRNFPLISFSLNSGAILSAILSCQIQIRTFYKINVETDLL